MSEHDLQYRSPEDNREPGIAIVPGSNYQKEMAKWEQFPHDKFAFGNPGNPYTYRPFPKMVYRAERYDGRIACMAAPPDSWNFKDGREYERATIAAQKFTERCQTIVHNEHEFQKAMEAGWRESPAEAVEFVMARDRAQADAAAHLNYEDRNLTEPAKREREAAIAAADSHVAEIPEKPKVKRRTSA